MVLSIFSLQWIIASLKEVLEEVLLWMDEHFENDGDQCDNNNDNDVAVVTPVAGDDDVGENKEVPSPLPTVDAISEDNVKQCSRHKVPEEFKGEMVTTFCLSFMAYSDIYATLAMNNSKRIYHKMQTNGDIFCGEKDKEMNELAKTYLYDECMDKCNMKEMNQVACFLMLIINGRVKCEKEKKKNMLNLIKKFVNFCRYFSDEQCKGMSYPINLLCAIYRKNEYLHDHGLEKCLIPVDAELKYLKKIVSDPALLQQYL